MEKFKGAIRIRFLLNILTWVYSSVLVHDQDYLNSVMATQGQILFVQNTLFGLKFKYLMYA